MEENNTQPALTPKEQRHARALLDIRTIYYEPAALDYARGREIMARFPDAERIEAPSHWNMPNLHGNAGLVEDWIATKRHVLVVGARKSLPLRPNGRSADFISPGQSNGCTMSCAYCVAAGTLIATPQGQVPVEQIQDGDEVFAYDSSLEQLVIAHVFGTAAREVDEVLEIEVGDTTLRVTAEHPLLTRRGWVKAGDLSEDDEVLCDDGRIA